MTSNLMHIGLNHYLVLSAMLFAVGMMTILLRKNIIIILMGVELMLNAVNISFVAFSHYSQVMHGQVMVFFILAVAAAEAAVGLALAVTIYKHFNEVNISKFESLKG